METKPDILAQIGITEEEQRKAYENLPTPSLENALHHLEEEEVAVMDESDGGTRVQTEPFGVMGAELTEITPIMDRLKEVGLPVGKNLTEAVRANRKLKIKVIHDILALR